MERKRKNKEIKWNMNECVILYRIKNEIETI